MIKIFSDKKSAQELCDNIHEFLKTNCPNYAAASWQDPTPNEKGTAWYVQLPKEYTVDKNEKLLYWCKESVADVVMPQVMKATASVQKLPDDWVTAAPMKLVEEKLTEEPSKDALP